MTSVITPRVVRYAAQECAWQQSGEVSVARMVDGWLYAHRRRNRSVSLRHVLDMAQLVDPAVNTKGLRTAGAYVFNQATGVHEFAPPQLIRRLLTKLIAAQPFQETVTEGEALGWFVEYEEIHPFTDGNGRTGSLLFNWLRGSLPHPIHPPNVWATPVRDVLTLPLEVPA